jgi:dephospho-CoA kinase
MNQNQRVALTGKMHSGKTTISDVMVEELGFTRLAFADPVKDISVKATNAILYEIHRMLGSGYPWDLMTRERMDASKQMHRLLLQHVGAYGRNSIDEDVWVRIMETQNFPTMVTPPKRIVVDDLRYLNEADYLKAKDFKIYRVQRDEKERVKSIEAAYEQTWGQKPTKKELKKITNHESETEVDMISWDEVVWNDTDAEGLRAWARGTFS